MIDWKTTSTSRETTRNKDKVTIVCEGCGASRPVLYQVAKRRKEHKCMPCLKRIGEFTTGQIMTYKCADCPATKEQPYSCTRFPNWRCHHCAMKKGHRDGKFIIIPVEMTDEVRKKISDKAKLQWSDPAYRSKWKKSRDKTKPKRSAISKAMWEKPGHKEDMAKHRAAQSGRVSSLQLKLYSILDSLEINYHPEGPETAIGYYVFDCLVPSTDPGKKSVLIEAQGRYWHSLPKNKANDRSKATYVSRYKPEYEILYIEEHEFKDTGSLSKKLSLRFLSQQSPRSITHSADL